MNWSPEEIVGDFQVVAELAGIKMQRDAIRIETLPMPHKPPSSLSKGKMAVCVFSDTDRVLMVGKVGRRSQPRYTSQHYTGSAQSTLARVLLKDAGAVQKHGLNHENVSSWIKGNTDRTNFILDADLGMRTLTLLKAFVECRLQPVFENFAATKQPAKASTKASTAVPPATGVPVLRLLTQEKPKEYKAGSARHVVIAWLREHEGATLPELEEAWKRDKPSLPKSGVQEKLGGWIAFAKREGVAEMA